MDDFVANLVIAQLLFLESEEPEKDINFYINSPGGLVTAGLAIYDTMQYIKPDIQTICIGQAASMGALARCGRHAGKSILPHAQNIDPSAHGRLPRPGTDIEIHAREILRMRQRAQPDSGQTHRSDRSRRSKSTPNAIIS